MSLCKMSAQSPLVTYRLSVSPVDQSVSWMHRTQFCFVNVIRSLLFAHGEFVYAIFEVF